MSTRNEPQLVRLPDSIATNDKYISLVLTGEIPKIAPDGTQSTFATLPLG